MRVRGVTMIEMLVVLVVVGVLAAIALPAYRQHMVRVNRTEATTLLHEIAAAEERYYLQQGRYTASINAGSPAGLGLGSPMLARHYAFDVALAADAQSFIANATPIRGRGQDSDEDCLAFSLDHRGRRGVSGSRDTAHCWR